MLRKMQMVEIWLMQFSGEQRLNWELGEKPFCNIMANNLASFCPCSENLSEDKLKNGIAYLVVR